MAENNDETTEVNIKFTTADKTAGSLELPLSSTVGTLKTMIRDKFGMEPKRLIYQGRMLNKDDQTLQETRFITGHTIVVQPAVAAVATTSTNSITPARVPVPATAAAPTASSNPLASNSPAAQALAQALAGQLTGARAGTGIGTGVQTGASASNPAVEAVETVLKQPRNVALECFRTLVKVIDNIMQHPMEEKYRKIKRSNAGFKRKVGGVPGGDACMRALGFQETPDEGGTWTMTPSANAWNVLTSAKVQFTVNINRLASSTAATPAGMGRSQGGSSSNITPSSATDSGMGGPGADIGGLGAGMGTGTGMGMGSGMGSYGGVGEGGRGGLPNMDMMRQMFPDEASVRRVLDNPAAQAMARGNPQMQAALQMLSTNPGLMQQAMNSPAFQQQAQAMTQGNLGAGSSFPQIGSALPTSPPPPAPGAAGAGVGSSSAGPRDVGGEGGQAEMSEDDLLAEAIMRSLQER
ncbi:unnamed protein product [Discosporangium mesarthrocarpum]